MWSEGHVALAGNYRSMFGRSRFVLKNEALSVTDKTYLFKELYTETMIRNPKKVGLSGHR